MDTSSDLAPSERQLRYLRGLAGRTGTTFAYPQSRTDASREIDRLRHLDEEARISRLEDPETQSESLHYATAVQADEVSGFGSSASWRSGAASPPPAARPKRPVSHRTELARYTVNSEERVLYGRQINGGVRVTDRPARGRGRSYLVERHLEHDGYRTLMALLADYIERAREFDEVPMASAVIRQLLEPASRGA
jgi:hypothetical protein